MQKQRRSDSKVMEWVRGICLVMMTLAGVTVLMVAAINFAGALGQSLLKDRPSFKLLTPAWHPEAIQQLREYHAGYQKTTAWYDKEVLRRVSIMNAGEIGFLHLPKDMKDYTYHLIRTPQMNLELFAATSDFIDNQGLWFQLCDHLKDRGFTPEEIANGFNQINAELGRIEELTAEDCQP